MYFLVCVHLKGQSPLFNYWIYNKKNAIMRLFGGSGFQIRNERKNVCIQTSKI